MLNTYFPEQPFVISITIACTTQAPYNQGHYQPLFQSLMTASLVLQYPSQPRPSAPDLESAHVAFCSQIFKSAIPIQLWNHSNPERVYLFVVVVRHLQPSPLEPALDVESFVGIAAIKDSLVATDFIGDKVEGLDQPQTQFLALLVLCDGDVFDVANHAKIVNTSSERNTLAMGNVSLQSNICMGSRQCRQGEAITGHHRGGGQGLQFPLGNQCASSNNPPSILNDKHVIAPILLANPLEAVGELGFSNISDGG